MMPPSVRAALYWTPTPDDPLNGAANAWLGRDPERNIACAQPPIPRIAEITEAPRHYGFHATLRPPMRLATGWEEFCLATETLAATSAAFPLPELEVAELSGFLALRERVACPALHALADACVVATDPHRLPPTDAEHARRGAAHLTPREAALLDRWGYPYVMQAWRFHMTLTRRLDPAEMHLLLPAAKAHFAEALAVPRSVRDIAIFTQTQNRPFLIAERFALAARS